MRTCSPSATRAWPSAVSSSSSARSSRCSSRSPANGRGTSARPTRRATGGVVATAVSAIAATGELRRRTAAAGVWRVYRIERRKLVAQLATRVLALICVLGPFAFAAILKVQSGTPADTLFGVWVHSSGFAVSLVVLGFAGHGASR